MLSAIVSILIGNFLIGLIFKPALDHLREIREKLLSVVVPLDEVHHRSFRLRKPWNAEEFEKADEASRHEINEILRKYTLAYHAFRRIGIVFVVGGWSTDRSARRFSGAPTFRFWFLKGWGLCASILRT